jgi:cytoskeletal protein CcmA (bactofilin family)
LLDTGRERAVQIDIKADTVIGAGSFFEGMLVVKGNLRIDGKFEGKTLVVDQLQVGQKGRVRTSIEATSVVVEGMVIGNIAATRRILLLATARVLGDLRTPELIIQDGVILEGKCTISHVEMENAKAYLETLYSTEEP